FARSCAREPAARFATAGEQVAALAATLGVAGDAELGHRAAAATVVAAGSGAPPGASQLAVPVATLPAAWSPDGPRAPAPVASRTPARRARTWLALGAALVAVAGASVALTLALGPGAPSGAASASAPASTAPPPDPAPAASSAPPAPTGPVGRVEGSLYLGAPEHYAHDALVAAIDPALPAALACCRTELAARPQASGRVTMALGLDPGGRVTVATCMPEGDVSSTLCECVRVAALRWSFPRRKTTLPMVTVAYQLGCRP
ncbi:MAG: hypothetical protein IT373_09065, partial [Polyangiaceae bacterium]|nr:hypothetical protein [Polyangiaceae bacterium]